MGVCAFFTVWLQFFWAFGFRVFRTIWIAFCFSWVIKGCVYHMLHWRHEEFMQTVPWNAGAQSLLNILPEMENLANCSFVYATFTTFVNQRCDPLKSVFRNLWIPMVILSTAMTLLCICWMLALHRNLHQRYLGTIHARDYSPTKTAPPKNELEMTWMIIFTSSQMQKFRISDGWFLQHFYSPVN